MQKWQYMVVFVTDEKIMTVNNKKVGEFGFLGSKGPLVYDSLDTWGTDGWELVTVITTSQSLARWIFKRLIA